MIRTAAGSKGETRGLLTVTMSVMLIVTVSETESRREVNSYLEKSSCGKLTQSNRIKMLYCCLATATQLLLLAHCTSPASFPPLYIINRLARWMDTSC